uniref:Uncharacterized protein n=1 Tax=Solanum lycopersicum TaxID=4081 RepID=A0A3Q7EM69_SOLLC
MAKQTNQIEKKKRFSEQFYKERKRSLSTEEVGLVERFVLEIELFGFCGTDWTELLFFLNCYKYGPLFPSCYFTLILRVILYTHKREA